MVDSHHHPCETNQPCNRHLALVENICFHLDMLKMKKDNNSERSLEIGLVKKKDEQKKKGTTTTTTTTTNFVPGQTFYLFFSIFILMFLLVTPISIYGLYDIHIPTLCKRPWRNLLREDPPTITILFYFRKKKSKIFILQRVWTFLPKISWWRILSKIRNKIHIKNIKLKLRCYVLLAILLDEM